MRMVMNSVVTVAMKGERVADVVDDATDGNGVARSRRRRRP